MGDKATLAKARQELEDLYLGVPDDSVNLSFKDFAGAQQAIAGDRNNNSMEPIQENGAVDLKTNSGAMGKSPSLDFSKALEASRVRRVGEAEIGRSEHRSPVGSRRSTNTHRLVGNEVEAEQVSPASSRRSPFRDNAYGSSLTYDDISVMSMTSGTPYEGRGGRKRPGIPHSNICTICSVYVYVFRHRCLVCGRVYCRQCVSVGMGEMTEGRKCIECLGRRFSQRYIKKAGEVGCCMGYPNSMKQQEIKWAEMGPRRSGDRRYGVSGHMSRSRSPVMPRTPTRVHVSSSPTSFVMSGTYSPTAHHIPF